MKVTFLGTGTSQGVPIVNCDCAVCRSLDYRDKRLRTSLHVLTDGGQSIVIDTGPDFRQQALRTRIPRLDAVFFTHHHKDHTAGFDDIRPFFFAQGLHDIPVYAGAATAERLQVEFAYMFEEVRYPGAPSVDLRMVQPDTPFTLQGETWTPIHGLHYKMQVFGFRLRDFVYLTDMNFLEEGQKELLKGAEVLVVNALHHKEHISHFNLQQALSLIEEVAPKQAYLTHMSHSMGLHKEVEAQYLPPHVHLAYDGLELNIP